MGFNVSSQSFVDPLGSEIETLERDDEDDEDVSEDQFQAL
jgi:hypothetical protein